MAAVEVIEEIAVIAAVLSLLCGAVNVGVTVWSARRGRPFAAASALGAAIACLIGVLALVWTIAGR